MKTENYIELQQISPGTCRNLKVLRYTSSNKGPKVYIQAGLHADEAPGYLVAHHLEQLLDNAEILGEIILIPAANPIGLSQWKDDFLQGRFHFSNSINFNRQHYDIINKTKNIIAESLTQDAATNITLIRDAMGQAIEEIVPIDEAEHLKKILLQLAYDSDIVLDLHCDHQAILHLYMGTPLWPDGSDLAAFLESQVVLLAKDSGDNPFDEACSRPWWDIAGHFPQFPIPPACFSVTVELRGIADTTSTTFEKDAQNIFAFLQNRNVVAGEPKPPQNTRIEATPLTGVDYIKATIPGIIEYLKQPGDYVNEGEAIARIINPLPHDDTPKVVEVMSRTSGLLFTRLYDRFARPGRIIAKVAGSTPLRRDEGNLLTQ